MAALLNKYPWLESYLTVPQLIGILGFLLGISAFLQKRDNAFRVHLTLVNIVMVVHFYLLGPDSYTAAILNIINIFRNIASAYTKNTFIMLFFIALMWGFSLPTLFEPIQYLSVIGTSIVTFSMFKLAHQKMRLGILLSSALWIIYSLWIHSVGSLLMEITFAVVNIYTIFKLMQLSSQAKVQAKKSN